MMTASSIATSPTDRNGRAAARLFSKGDSLGGLVRALGRLFRGFQRRSVEQDWQEARLVLGRRMYEVGIDDGSLGAEIAALEANLREYESLQLSTAELIEERDELLLRLADLALEDDAPLPGAAAEYRRVRELEAVISRAQLAVHG